MFYKNNLKLLDADICFCTGEIETSNQPPHTCERINDCARYLDHETLRHTKGVTYMVGMDNCELYVVKKTT
jgi:GTP cyclohydrolase III